MSRYIDAEKIEYFALSGYGLTNKQFAHKPQIEEIPTADVAPVIHAHWKITHPYLELICSRCAEVADKEYEYCHCGAKMDEKE